MIKAIKVIREPRKVMPFDLIHFDFEDFDRVRSNCAQQRRKKCDNFLIVSLSSLHPTWGTMQVFLISRWTDCCCVFSPWAYWHIREKNEIWVRPSTLSHPSHRYIKMLTAATDTGGDSLFNTQKIALVDVIAAHQYLYSREYNKISCTKLRQFPHLQRFAIGLVIHWCEQASQQID